MQDIFSKIKSDQETASNFPRIDSMTRVQLSFLVHKLNERFTKILKKLLIRKIKMKKEC